jgi:hypothetical protein
MYKPRLYQRADDMFNSLTSWKKHAMRISCMTAYTLVVCVSQNLEYYHQSPKPSEFWILSSRN